jgi:hypothetical protein
VSFQGKETPIGWFCYKPLKKIIRTFTPERPSFKQLMECGKVTLEQPAEVMKV